MPLSSAERALLSNLQVVGLKYYDSFDALTLASRAGADYEQSLFLVPEINNMHDINAVMLHNGKRKLGSLKKEQAPEVRKLLASWVRPYEGRGPRQEDVIVVASSWLDDNKARDMKYNGYINVKGIYRVNERLARKFSDEYRKE